MGQMFFDCSSLTSITFGDNFDTSKVTKMSSIFAYAEALKTLDLSGFNTKNVENMAQMFFKCSSLTSITFGDNFNTSNVTNKIDMFSYCKSLTKIYLNNEEERTRLSSLKPASAKYYNY